MNKSKVSLAVSQIIEKIEMIVGLCWAGFWLLAAVIYMFEEEIGIGWTIASFLLVLLGVVVFSWGRKRSKMRQEFKKYVTQLSVDPSGSLENLASATGTSVDVVKKNLQFMIKKNFFANATINEQEHQLVLPAKAKKEQQAKTPRHSASGAAQQELIVCSCPCCGGMNKIAKGTAGECDFCGSPLQG